jgi:hypothetical protein
VGAKSGHSGGTASAPNDPLMRGGPVTWTSRERAQRDEGDAAQGLTVARKRLASRLAAPNRAAVNVERLTVIHLPRSVTRKITISAHSLPSLS